MTDEGNMTDQKVMSFANEIRKEKYCRKYMDCHVCPLFIQKEQNRECIDSLYCNELYKKIFLDGFNAAFDVPIEKIKSL